MLEKEVFRIRRDHDEHCAEVRAVAPTTAEAATPADSAPPDTTVTPANTPLMDGAMPINAAALPLDSAADASAHEHVSICSLHDQLLPASQAMPPVPPSAADGTSYSNASPNSSSSQHHTVLAERAATSFRQDRRLQRGQIGLSGHKTKGQGSAPLPVSPTWTGLPDSVLHGAKSPACLPLPASDSGISDTEFNLKAAAAHLHLSEHAEGSSSAEVSSGDASACHHVALTAEDDEGDVEYKWRLTGISATRFQHLVTQMQFRVSEGRGQCLYELGVSDDGTPRGLTRHDFDESVQTIQRMAAQLQLEATLLQCCAVAPSAEASGGRPRRSPKRGCTPSSRASTPHMAASTGASVKKETAGNHEGAAAASEDVLLCGEIMVSRRQSSSAHDLSIAFCGAVGCGKSTLMAVLLTARLDDGRGGTRQSLFNHKHELNSGRTSSLASRVWTVPQDSTDAYALPPHYSSPTPPLPPSDLPNPKLGPSRFQPTWSPVATAPGAPPTPPFTCASPRSLTLLDAGGDITKTMLFGLMSRKPDYVCVCVAADTSDVSDVSLYAEVCCAMNTPFLVAVTKSDCVAEFELDGLMMELTVALENVGCVAEAVETKEVAAAYCRDWLPRHREAAVDGGDAYARFASPTTSTAATVPSTTVTTTAAAAETSSPVTAASAGRLRVPVFCVSSVEGGDGLDLLRSCLSHLQNPPPSPPQSPPSCASKPPFEVLLDCAFEVDDVGSVVHGRVAHGPVEVGCACYIGPGSDGRFYPVLVRGIHVDGEHVNMAQVGDEATFALDRLPKAVTVSHKGKVLVRQPERVTMAFTATVQVLSQSISAHMEPILYTRNARQAVNVLTVSAAGATGLGGATTTAASDAAGPAAAIAEADSSTHSGGPQDGTRECTVRCRFLFRPEVVGPGDAVVLHWAPRGIAVGRIVSVEASGGERRESLKEETKSLL